jgi:hypothetical protein
MLDQPDAEFAKLAASVKCGSIVASAGCGKTEQIARATQVAAGRRLILTHTHAGVDALRKRLQNLKVTSGKYRVETIAGWSLRYGASFPKRSELQNGKPRIDADWNSVYEAAAKLVGTGAVTGVLTSSYSGVFVDEYQDCSNSQHEVVKAISAHLPVCIFGDPLQAIFDFKGQKPVNWGADVFPTFAKAGELSTPWRWNNAGNTALADWLTRARKILEKGGPLDLATRPACVRWHGLPADPGQRLGMIVGTCKTAMGQAGDGSLIVIGDAANINSRAALAQKLASVGFSTIEPLGCSNLYTAAKILTAKAGFARLEAAMDFIVSCMTGAERTLFLNAVKSQQRRGKAGAEKFGFFGKNRHCRRRGKRVRRIAACINGRISRKKRHAALSSRDVLCDACCITHDMRTACERFGRGNLGSAKSATTCRAPNRQTQCWQHSTCKRAGVRSRGHRPREKYDAEGLVCGPYARDHRADYSLSVCADYSCDLTT